MNIVVVGLGSMGRRRIRLLKQISDKIHITGIDMSSERCKQVEDEFNVSTNDSIEKYFDNNSPDCAIISTSPISHSNLINKCLEHNCHIFTEINLVNDGYMSNIQKAKDKNKVLFLSSTFLYRDEINYIRTKINDNDGGLNYTYHVGQYLPDWHPWESIKDYFVGNKRTNGCRELFAIELPWIIKAFGPIESIDCSSDKMSCLPVDYNDNYILKIKHKNGNKGLLAVDVISRKAVRNLEVYGENLYISWDGSPYGLKEYDFIKKEEKSIVLYDSVDKQNEYAAFVIENAYRNELETFLKVIKGQGNAEYTFEEDYEVLSIIDKIELGENG